MNAPLHLIVGPDEHGVTVWAQRLADALAAPVVRVPAWRDTADATAADAALPPGEAVHLHVTDHLLGPAPEEAAEAVGKLAASRPVTLTLHDLPQHSDGPGRRERRTRAYAAMARVAQGIVVSSDHERRLLLDCLSHGEDLPIAVVPLPVEVATSAVPEGLPGSREVAMLGFVYPGKGHAEALEGLIPLPEDVGLTVLGRASTGHEDLVTRLSERAARLGRRLTVTGFLPDDDLDRRLRAVTVPLAAHRHVSASASIATWIAAGRRPLVPRDRYTEELDRRMPGCLTVYDALGPAVAEALEHPDTTWLAAGARPGPGTAEVAARYREVLALWLAA